MMQSEKKITRENALEIIKKFAKEYRKMENLILHISKYRYIIYVDMRNYYH